MIRDRWKVLWRISETSTLSNQNMFVRGLPPPSNSLYRTYSARVPQSEGGLTLQGYINCEVFWEVLMPEQAKVLRDIVDTVGSGEIYLTIDKQNAEGLEDDFIDIRGRPHMPAFDSMPGSMGRAIRSVTLKINNITVVNDPAVF